MTPKGSRPVLRGLVGSNAHPATQLIDFLAVLLGYTGRKRGEVVRTRTTVAQAHSYHWLGSFGNRGNGHYREELRKGLAAIDRYLTASQLPSERTLLRLDGHYGTGATFTPRIRFSSATISLRNPWAIGEPEGSCCPLVHA